MNRYCVFLFFLTSDHVLWNWRRFIYFWTFFPCECLTSEKFSAFRSLEFALDRTKRVKIKGSIRSQAMTPNKNQTWQIFIEEKSVMLHGHFSFLVHDMLNKKKVEQMITCVWRKYAQPLPRKKFPQGRPFSTSVLFRGAGVKNGGKCTDE